LNDLAVFRQELSNAQGMLQGFSPTFRTDLGFAAAAAEELPDGPTTTIDLFALAQEFGQPLGEVMSFLGPLIGPFYNLQQGPPGPVPSAAQITTRAVLAEVQGTINDINRELGQLQSKYTVGCKSYAPAFQPYGPPPIYGPPPYALPPSPANPPPARGVDGRTLRQAVAECKKFLAGFPDLVNSTRDRIAAALDSRLKRTETRFSALTADIPKAELKLQEIQRALSKQSEISNILISYALPAFGLVTLLLVGLPAVYKLNVQTDIFSQGLILEIITVFLLVAAILILGLADKIPTQALGTLLGGISGFVLGRNVAAARARTEVRATPPAAPPGAA
jgi:hypothetical protein